MSARYRINNQDYYTLAEITQHFSITTEQAVSRFESESRLWSKWVDREHQQNKEAARQIEVARYRPAPVKTVANTITDPRPKGTAWTTYDARDRRAAEAKKVRGKRIQGDKRFNHRTMAIKIDHKTFANKELAAEYLDICTQTMMTQIRNGSNPRISVIGKISGRVLDLTLN